jgi:hypothetical protein
MTDPLIHRERSFYGVMRVFDENGGRSRRLVHGSTLHGNQQLAHAPVVLASCLIPWTTASPLDLTVLMAEGDRYWTQKELELPPRRRPITYYQRSGPMGQIFAAKELMGGVRRVAVAGLGTGALSCYAQPGQEWTYYEIDPAVERIARTHFTFLNDCLAPLRVELGDARLTMARAPDKAYDLIILDAFSSDAIPIHLMTKQAIEQVYLPKLADDGILVFHISNRYLDLEPVLSDLARTLGLECLAASDDNDDAIDKSATTVVILARNTAAFGKLALDAPWAEPHDGAGKHIWTDDFSNILGVFRDSLFAEWAKVKRWFQS